jgi:hypothetical protein
MKRESDIIAAACKRLSASPDRETRLAGLEIASCLDRIRTMENTDAALGEAGGTERLSDICIASENAGRAMSIILDAPR